MKAHIWHQKIARRQKFLFLLLLLVFVPLAVAGVVGGYLYSHQNSVLSDSTTSGTTTTCQPPPSGCPANYIWNTSYCTCVTSTTSTSGTSGSNTCQPPATGCPANYYWDSGSCTCKYYSGSTTCQPPSSGCPTNYLWESGSCTCKYIGTTSGTNGSVGCTAPVAGCPSASTWDSGSCTCKTSTSGSCQPPSSGCPLNSSWDSSSCSCKQFSTQSATSSGGVTGATENITYYSSSQQIPVSVDNCLKQVLTATVYQQVKAGQTQQVPYELRDKVRSCFTGSNKPTSVVGSIAIPDSVKSCLVAAVGQTRFTQINDQHAEPTEIERSKGQSCFTKLNPTEAKFLPPPAEQIPFVPIDNNTVKLAEAKQEIATVSGRTGTKGIAFKGKAIANSTVDLYIYSEPIVVTTKADQNGDWVYELSQPLTGEKHLAYALTQDNSGREVKSDVFNFTVVAAEEPAPNTLLPETKIGENSTQKFVTTAVVAVLGALALAMAGFAVFFVFKESKKTTS